MAILNILNELANSYIIRKENIAEFYGLIEKQDPYSYLLEMDTNKLNDEVEKCYKQSIEESSNISYKVNFVPVIMKEIDESVVYFVEYSELKKYSKDTNNDIVSSLCNICEQNDIYIDDISVCLINNEESRVDSIKESSLKSDNRSYKINNKFELLDLYNDIISLKESGIMLFKQSNNE